MSGRSSFLLSFIEELINDYAPSVTDRSLNVLDIHIEGPSVRVGILEIPGGSSANSKFKVSYREDSCIHFVDESSQRNCIEDVFLESQLVAPGSDKKGDDLQSILVRAQSESGVAVFDVIVADHVISKADMYHVGDHNTTEAESCGQLLDQFWEMLRPGGELVVREVYLPDWRVDELSDGDAAPNPDSLIQHFEGREGIKPDKLIELATFKRSRRKENYNFLYESRYVVRSLQSDSCKVSAVSDHLSSENSDDTNGWREFAFALERSQKLFDDSRIVETVKNETEVILKGLGLCIKLLRSAETADDYQKVLNKFLSNSSNRQDSVYLRLGRCLYLQILLEAINSGLDLSLDRIVFWLAYESGSPKLGIMPAIEPEDERYPLFGYSFGGTDEGAFYDTPSNESLTRKWLNIILHAGFKSSRYSERPPLKPPSVHEWFVQHAPVVITPGNPPDEPPEEHSLETLTVYVGNDKNQSLALVEGHNSSRRHHRVELRPYREANDGELWGFQLAEELAKIKSSASFAAEKVAWPYDEQDQIPGVVNVKAFRGETERLKEAYKSGAEIRASYGWIRGSLYSLFLAMCLGDDEERFTEPRPEWIDFFLVVLKNMGYEELGKMILRSFLDSVAHVRSGKHIPLSSLTWVTPPTLVSLIGDSPRGLGSILIISSRLLPVVAFRHLKNQLLNIFLALREAEELIEGQHRAKLITSLLSNDAFSHELSKVAIALERFLLPVETVFQTANTTLVNANLWNPPAGIMTLSDQDKEIVKSWKVSPTPLTLKGLRDLILTWSGSATWIEKIGLEEQRPFAEAFNAILRTGITAGVVQSIGIYKAEPANLQTAIYIDRILGAERERLVQLIGPPNIPTSLIWTGTAEARLIQSAFARALIAAITNAIVHISVEPEKLEVNAMVSDNQLVVAVLNSRDPEDPWNPPGGTRRVLENCAQILNDGSTDSTLVHFGPDTNDRNTWRTEYKALLKPLDESGNPIEWLKLSLQ